MRFVVEHINKVREADILLNGLTVIAGENDSGKSTVGKLLFSTIKALANTRVWEGMDRRDLLEKHVSSLYKRLFTGPYRRKDNEISSLFPLSIRLVSELLALEPGQLNDFLQKRIEAIERLENVTPRNKMLMLRDIDNIRICLMESGNRAAGLTAEIQYFIESEFMNKICSFQTDSSRVELYIDNHEEVNLSYSIEKDKVGKVEVIWGESLQDATYIESPLYVHLMDSLLYATSLREIDNRFMRPMVPSHIKDLMEKINSMRFVNKRRADVIVGYLEGIMGGRFEFDGKTRNLFFSRDKVHFSPINVASGIKTFGLIQMLIETGVISENKVLIWDEPENHLHPRWQVEFAHVLVYLAKAGIPVLISTHSPYFIQGIRYFSAMEDVEQFVNYYLTEEKEGLAELMEVSNDLNRVFLKLAEPLNNIMNVDDVRVSKKSK